MSTVTIAVDLAKNVFRDRCRRPRRHHQRAKAPLPFPVRAVLGHAHSLQGSDGGVLYLSLLGQETDRPRLRGHPAPNALSEALRRGKTDCADCEAILEAYRYAGIHPGRNQEQVLAALHRVRSQWIACRTARINGMRALLREFGLAVPLGSKRFMNDLHRLLREKQDRLPERVRRTVLSLWDEVRYVSNGSTRSATNSPPPLKGARDARADADPRFRHPDGPLRDGRRHPRSATAAS